MLDPIQPPSINREMLLSMDPYNQTEVENLKKLSQENGLSNEFAEGVVLELRKLSEQKEGQKKDLLKQIRKDMLKEASLLEDPGHYTSEYIHSITESAENFEKAAMLESMAVWEGFREEMLKSGKDEAFIEGIVKEANIGNILKLVARNPLSSVKALAKTPLSKVKATEQALAGAKNVKAPGALYSTTGEAVTHGLPEGHIAGSRRSAFLGNLEKELGQAATPRDASLLQEAKQNVQGKINKGIAEGSSNAFQSRVNDISERAMQGDRVARQQMREISKGNFSSVENQLNLKPGQIGQQFQSQAQGIGGTVQDAQEYAKNLRASGYGRRAPAPAPYANQMNTGLANIPANAPIGAPSTKAPGTFRMFSPTPGKGLSRAASGAMLGGMVGGLPGAAVGAGLGGLSGTFGTGTTAALGTGAALYGGKKLLDATGITGTSSELDPVTGARVDRNRIVPFAKNSIVGGVGGWMLGSMLAQRMGLQGLPAWIIPLLGAMAGKEYLPQMMNQWKDPYGTGVNRINPGAALLNQQYSQQYQ